jgi:hypothetical protein
LKSNTLSSSVIVEISSDPGCRIQVAVFGKKQPIDTAVLVNREQVFRWIGRSAPILFP